MHFPTLSARTGLVICLMVSAGVASAGPVTAMLPDNVELNASARRAGELPPTMQRCVGMDLQSPPQPTESRFCRTYHLQFSGSGGRVAATYVATGPSFLLSPEAPPANISRDGMLISTADRAFGNGEGNKAPFASQGRYDPPVAGRGLETLDTNTSTPLANALNSGVVAVGRMVGIVQPGSPPVVSGNREGNYAPLPGHRRYDPTGPSVPLDGNTSTPLVNAIKSTVAAVGTAFGVGQSNNPGSGSGRIAPAPARPATAPASQPNGAKVAPQTSRHPCIPQHEIAPYTYC